MEEINNRYKAAVLAFLKAKQIRKEFPLLDNSEVISRAIDDVLTGKVKYAQVKPRGVEAKTPPPAREKPSPAKPRKETKKKTRKWAGGGEKLNGNSNKNINCAHNTTNRNTTTPKRNSISNNRL